MNAIGDKDTGFVYEIEWWDKQFKRTLECATKNYSESIRRNMKILIKVIFYLYSLALENNLDTTTSTLNLGVAAWIAIENQPEDQPFNMINKYSASIDPLLESILRLGLSIRIPGVTITAFIFFSLLSLVKADFAVQQDFSFIGWLRQSLGTNKENVVSSLPVIANAEDISCNNADNKTIDCTFIDKCRLTDRLKIKKLNDPQPSHLINGFF